MRKYSYRYIGTINTKHIEFSEVIILCVQLNHLKIGKLQKSGMIIALNF